MYCTNCGNEIQNDSRFCTICGTQLSFSNQSDSELNQSQKEKIIIRGYETTKRRNNSRTIIVIGVIVLLAGIGFLVYQFGGGRDKLLEKQLTGTWNVPIDSAKNPFMKIESSSISFFPNEKFTAEITISAMGIPTQLILTGNWEIKDGYLCMTSLDSNIPDSDNSLLSGFNGCYKILNLSSSELTTETDGREDTYYKKN